MTFTCKVHGPYKHGARWRVVSRDEHGRQSYASYGTKDQAVSAINEARGVSLDEAISFLSQRVTLPDDPVWVYFLTGDNDEILYVGSTRRPDRRRCDHAENGVPFKGMKYIPIAFDRSTGMRVEHLLIQHLSPPLNGSCAMTERPRRSAGNTLKTTAARRRNPRRA